MIFFNSIKLLLAKLALTVAPLDILCEKLEQGLFQP